MLRLALGLGLAGTVVAAEIPLYPTGPSEDAAFLRFVNAGSASLELLAAGSEARLHLEGASVVSDYLAVSADKSIRGQLQSNGKSYPLELSVKPGEFTSVVGIPTADNGLQVLSVSEQPDDFNALKVSLAFYSLDPSCAAASLVVTGRNVELFKAVPTGTLQRRSINPVNLSVQLRCSGSLVGNPLVFEQLKAAERYSVFLVPSAQGSRLFQAQDVVGH
ncbi:MAG: alginate O-acetyltransferase AlgF [Pseudomonadaceae bacterium]|nr:alginate O-acetyltransferase AlgF [Pseudomonadaceae bacterium]